MRIKEKIRYLKRTEINNLQSLHCADDTYGIKLHSFFNNEIQDCLGTIR